MILVLVIMLYFMLLGLAFDAVRLSVKHKDFWTSAFIIAIVVVFGFMIFVPFVVSL